jgi:acetyl-CoA carboxylase biotin carboxyl carrier protein
MDVYDKIKELVEMMQDFDLSEIEIKDGDQEIKLRKGFCGTEMPMAPMTALPMNTQPAVPQDAAAAGGEAPAVERDPSLQEFKSPMVGTFYRAPSPESPPYVTEGDKASADTILCIIEAMKVMNEIRAEVSGEVVDILVENGEAVEFGQPLFLIRRAG